MKHNFVVDEAGCLCDDFEEKFEEELYLKQRYKKEIKCILVGAEEYIKLKEENNRLKEALRKCSPFKISGHCKFCSSDWIASHDTNCDYLRLIKESEVL
jgi:hypothetical protein